MNIQGDVVTDGRVELRADWEESSATLFWRPHGERGAAAPGRGGEPEGWQPSIYQVGDFDHDHERALRVLSALWVFLRGPSQHA